MITTSDATRFLGMDTHYDLHAGILTMGMDTYINANMERFSNFGLALGCPYRENVGCLLWIVLCVNGPDLVRVKDLAKRCNAPTPSDYQNAVKVLKWIFKRRGAVILFKREYAGRELVPARARSNINNSEPFEHTSRSIVSVRLSSNESSSNGHFSQLGVLDHIDALDIDLDIPDVALPTTTRLTTVAYTNASFAVGEMKDSISGYLIYVNGNPCLWGIDEAINWR
jgi:hypothetical protein